VPSAKAEIFWRMPSSKMRKSRGFNPSIYRGRLSVTMALNLTQKTGRRACVCNQPTEVRPAAIPIQSRREIISFHLLVQFAQRQFDESYQENFGTPEWTRTTDLLLRRQMINGRSASCPTDKSGIGYLRPILGRLNARPFLTRCCTADRLTLVGGRLQRILARLRAPATGGPPSALEPVQMVLLQPPRPNFSPKVSPNCALSCRGVFNGHAC
jgi:hypothetical protein